VDRFAPGGCFVGTSLARGSDAEGARGAESRLGKGLRAVSCRRGRLAKGTVVEGTGESARCITQGVVKGCVLGNRVPDGT
jgi:hypothetical protein